MSANTWYFYALVESKTYIHHLLRYSVYKRAWHSLRVEINQYPELFSYSNELLLRAVDKLSMSSANVA